MKTYDPTPAFHPPDWSLDPYDGAEADLTAVARHDFSGLSTPILVACYNQAQFEAFVFRHGLICSEVRRLSGSHDTLATMRADKILLLLPGWEKHNRTKLLAEKWIFDLDRYTVTLRGPHPSPRRPRILPATLTITLLLLAALAWLVLR